MGPKRVGPKAKAKAAAGPPSNNNITTTNTPIYADIERKLATVKAHPLMAHIEDEAVLTIAQGGRMAPFDERAFKMCMEHNNEYNCAGNFFWQNAVVSPTPSVTILKKNIDDVGQMHFPNPSQPVRIIPHTIHIGIPAADFDPKAHLGSLTRISPCEYVLAAIDRCFMAIESGADDATIKSWKSAFCTTTFCFKAWASPSPR